ncbi:MAG: heavy metal translocating P-type ATPase, partial [Acidimicrobiales bacterium]
MTVEHRAVVATDRHEGPGKGSHDDHADHGGHADHAEVFRRRFWWSVLLTLPIVATSEMVMEWFRYDLDFPGIELVGPVLGTVVVLWGGWPFL